MTYVYYTVGLINIQVGACIVNQDGNIVGFGYNGLPYGFDDSIISWGKFEDSVDPKDVKYPYGECIYADHAYMHDHYS